VIWTEEGVQGSWRFVQRLWRLVHEVSGIAVSAGKGGDSDAEAALSLRKAAHGALAKVSEDVPRLRFNRCVAHVYELANALQAALTAAKGTAAPAGVAAMREAVEIMVQLFAPMMPHLAEECWAALGHKTLIAEAPWPQVEAALLVEDTETLPVQINGKKRADVTVARDATTAEVERAVLELEAVQRALEGKPPKKVIVVPHRIVNVVA
jgi:leucyl-tRNA synthetase